MKSLCRSYLGNFRVLDSPVRPENDPATQVDSSDEKLDYSDGKLSHKRSFVRFLLTVVPIGEFLVQ
jgi:hypothetical protein